MDNFYIYEYTKNDKMEEQHLWWNICKILKNAQVKPDTLKTKLVETCPLKPSMLNKISKL